TDRERPAGGTSLPACCRRAARDHGPRFRQIGLDLRSDLWHEPDRDAGARRARAATHLEPPVPQSVGLWGSVRVIVRMSVLVVFMAWPPRGPHNRTCEAHPFR